MTLISLPADQRVPLPWKNGGGVTREVASFPPIGGLTDFDWRISLADVAVDGPFSAFDGYDRMIAVVAGAGMALTVDGTEHVVTRRPVPFAFSGASDTACRLLDGPIMDFNVMTRTGRVEADVQVMAIGGTVGLRNSETDDTFVVVSFGGDTATATATVGGMPLGFLDAVVVRGGPDVSVTADAGPSVAVVRLKQLSRQK